MQKTTATAPKNSIFITIVSIVFSIASLIGVWLIISVPIDIIHSSQIGNLTSGSLCTTSDGLQIECITPNIINLEKLVEGKGCSFEEERFVCNTSIQDVPEVWVACAPNSVLIGDECVDFFDTMTDAGFVRQDDIVTMIPNKWCRANSLGTRTDCIYDTEAGSNIVDATLDGICRGTIVSGVFTCLELIEELETDPKTGTLVANAMCLGVSADLFACEKTISVFIDENEDHLKDIVFSHDSMDKWCRNSPSLAKLTCDIAPLDSTSDLAEGTNLYFTDARVIETLEAVGAIEEPNGFDDLLNALETDESRRGAEIVFWIVGTHAFYCDGVYFVRNSTSVAFEVEDGLTYIFYDGNVLSQSRTVPRRGTVRVASVYHSGSVLGISDDRYRVGVTAEMRAALTTQLIPQVDAGIQPVIVDDEIELTGGAFSYLDRIFITTNTSLKQVVCWTDKWSVCPLTGHTGYWLMHLFVTNDIQERLLMVTGEFDYETAEEALQYKTREMHWAIAKGLPYTIAVPLASVLYSELGILQLVDQIDTNFLQVTIHSLLADLDRDDHPYYVLLDGRQGDVLHAESMVVSTISIENSTMASATLIAFDSSEVRVTALDVSSVMRANVDNVTIDVSVVLDGTSQITSLTPILVVGSDIFLDNAEHDVWSITNNGTLRFQPCDSTGVPTLDNILTVHRNGWVGVNCDSDVPFAVAALLNVSNVELWTSVPVQANGSLIHMGDVWELGTSGGAYIRAPSLLIDASLGIGGSVFIDTSIRSTIPVLISAVGTSFEIERDSNPVISVSVDETTLNNVVVVGGVSTGIGSMGATVIKNRLLWEGPLVMGMDNDNGVVRVNAYNSEGTEFQPSNILSVGDSGYVAINSAPNFAFFSVSDLDGNALFNISQSGIMMSSTPVFSYNNGDGQIFFENIDNVAQAEIGIRQSGILYVWQSLNNSATEFNVPSTSVLTVNSVSPANAVSKQRMTISNELVLVNVDMGLGVQTGGMLQGTNVFQVDSGGLAKFEVDPTSIRVNAPAWFRSSTIADQVLLASTGGGSAVIGVAESAITSLRKLYLWQSNSADIAANLPSAGRFVVSTSSGQTGGDPTTGTFVERVAFSNDTMTMNTQAVIDSGVSAMFIVRYSGVNKLVSYGTYTQSLVPLRVDYVGGTAQITMQRSSGGAYNANIGIKSADEMFIHQNTGTSALQLNVLSTSKVTVNTVDENNVLGAERLSITATATTVSIPVTVNVNSATALVVTADTDTLVSSGNAGTTINAPSGTIQLKAATTAKVTVGTSDTTVSTPLKCAYQAGGSQISLQRSTSGAKFVNIGIKSANELFIWQRSGTVELQMTSPPGAPFTVNTVDDTNTHVSQRLEVTDTTIEVSLPFAVDANSANALVLKNGVSAYFISGTGGAVVTAASAAAFVVGTGTDTLISSGNVGTSINAPSGNIGLMTETVARVTVVPAQTTISNLAMIAYQSAGPQLSMQRSSTSYMGHIGIRSTDEMFLWHRSGSSELQMNAPTTSSFCVATVNDTNVFNAYRMMASGTQITNYLPTTINYQAGGLQVKFKNAAGTTNAGIGYNADGDILMSQLESGEDIEMRLPNSATSNVAFTSYDGVSMVSRPLRVFQNYVETNQITRINSGGDVASGNIFDVCKSAGSMAFEIDASEMRVAVDSIVGIGGRLIKSARLKKTGAITLSTAEVTVFTVTISPSATVTRMARINGMLQLIQSEDEDGKRYISVSVECTNTNLGPVAVHGNLMNYNSGPNYSHIVFADHFFTINPGVTSVCTVKAAASSSDTTFIIDADVESFVQITTYVKDDAVMTVLSAGSSATI